ncbi:dephospho-CoA kinase [Blattabacterium sp. (Blattella germanica) str. Bge]|uniref:dephospho-CoA kinase n=1 Tax=Blattabacterium sp. (Blattella germanica) TaxID=624186 RepID=UPI0001BB6110|nr:dephospho-CoA kinase [Blattabacterium sp. (Blattella germanica)]ACY40218.1 dephospho-CoA kinase [Blattabacterium sp. (Blattella germanica) str. Bge]
MKFFLIGITGKMGSGKSLLSSFLKKKGIPVYSSDERGKILMNQTKIIKKNIIKHFGKDSYKKEKINKTYLSEIVFKNPIALKLLCSIVHPWISIDFKNWIFYVQKKALYVIKESAILFESGSYKECDFIINITSPIEKIIERIIKRDNLSENQIVNRLKNQISNKKRKEKSHLIINNYSSEMYLEKKADRIHELFENLYKHQYGKRR